jgi:hypothetical protein
VVGSVVNSGDGGFLSENVRMVCRNSHSIAKIILIVAAKKLQKDAVVRAKNRA